MSLNEITAIVPEAEVVAIEYPGFVRNTDKALRTLGGIDDIAAAVSSKHQYLKLKHRPEDRTSHPLYAERIDPVRLLVRIARPKQPTPTAPAAADGAHGTPAATDMDVDAPAPPSPSSTSPSTAAAPTQDAPQAGSAGGVTATVVARVNPTFRFPGLADYAFLPHDPLLASRTRELLPYDQRPDRAEPTKAPQPFLLIPQLFSWLDLPQDYAFKQLQSKHGPRVPGRTDPNWGDAPVISFYAEGVPPPVASAATATAAGAGAEAPATAASEAAAAAAAAGISDVRAYRVLETEVSRLLAQRAVWGLELMRERCLACPAVLAAMPGGCDAMAVERVVQRLCYRFKTGPWRGLFIRRGYDPRTQPDARKYQALVYSLPNNWYRSMLKVGVRAAQQQSTQQRKAGAAAAAAGGGSGEGAGQAGGDGGANGTSGAEAASPKAPLPYPTCLDDLHNFRALPTQQSTTFQLVDLQLKELQDALQEPLTMDSVRCSEKTGWFNNATMQLMQNAVQQRFLQLMDELAPPGAATSAASPGATGAAGTSPTAGRAAAGGRRAASQSPSAGVAGGRVGTAGGRNGARAAANGAAGSADVEMADAAAPSAQAAAAPRPAAASTAAANKALRHLMAQMNLSGLAAADGADVSDTGGGDADVGAGLAGLFGSDDDDDGYRLLDEQDEGGDGAGGHLMAQEGEEDGEAESEGVEGEEGEEDGEEDGEAGRRQRRRRRRRGAAATRPAAVAAGPSTVTAGRGGDVSEGEESVLESEYDAGLTGDEDDEDEEDLGFSGGGGGMYGSDGAYGRVTVPYDGGVPARLGDGMSNMFGSDDEDDPY